MGAGIASGGGGRVTGLGLLLGVVAASLAPGAATSSRAGDAAHACRDLRPAADRRAFRSAAVDAAVARLSARMVDPELACLFRNALPNTLDTTIFRFARGGNRPSPSDVAGSCARHYGQCGDGDVAAGGGDLHDDTFVVTGDIPAMWLRDSMNQALPLYEYIYIYIYIYIYVYP